MYHISIREVIQMDVRRRWMDDQYQISIRDLFIIHFVFTVVHLRFISDFLCHPAMAEAAACDAALPLLQAALSAAGGAGAW